MTAVRVIDISNAVFVEIPQDQLCTKIYSHIDLLQKERDTVLDNIKELLGTDMEAAIMIMAEKLTGNRSSGKAGTVQDLLERAKVLMQQIDRLFVIANNFATAPGKNIIRLTLEQAKDFGY